MKNYMNTKSKTTKGSKNAKRGSKGEVSKQALDPKTETLFRILESSLDTGITSLVLSNPADSHVVVATEVALASESGAIGCTWRLGEDLLNELGMHESTIDPSEWFALKLWASISHDREIRCLMPTGEFPEQRLQHRVRLPDAAAVDRFMADPQLKRLNLMVITDEQLAETLADRRVTLEGSVEASALELTRLASTLIRAVFRVEGRYEGYGEAKPKDSNEEPGIIKTNLVQHWSTGQERACVPAVDPKSALKLRTEFLGDAVAVRHLLAPFAVDWRDVEPSEFMRGSERRVSGWDRDIELTLADAAPGLDDLRWYLNQATDMHVAAESLHYAHRYTGERLPQDLVEDMLPTVDVRRDMAERLGKLCVGIEAMHERLVHAQAAINATLPREQTPVAKPRRRGKRG